LVAANRGHSTVQINCGRERVKPAFIACDPNARNLFWIIPGGKTMRIGCLHTADSNVAVFDAAAQALGPARPVLNHEVRADLLLAAEQAGGLTSDIADRTRAALLALCEGNDVVVLTWPSRPQKRVTMGPI
jgi:hypothetical protein